MHLGCHWIAEVVPVRRESLEESERVSDFLRVLPTRLGLNALYPPSIQQSEDGAVRGVVLLSESHASAHTDPGRGIVFVDLFSCAAFEPSMAREVLLDIWPGEVLVERFLSRGVS